jgi:protein gp37
MGKPVEPGLIQGMNRGEKIDWIIVGGESGPGARPFNIRWARSTIAQCRTVGCAVFIKQLGSNARTNAICGYDDAMQKLQFRDRKGGDPAEWDSDLRVREFPR